RASRSRDRELEREVVMRDRREWKRSEERGNRTRRVLHVEVAVRQAAVLHLPCEVVVAAHVARIDRAEEASPRGATGDDERPERDQGERQPPHRAILRFVQGPSVDCPPWQLTPSAAWP